MMAVAGAASAAPEPPSSSTGGGEAGAEAAGLVARWARFTGAFWKFLRPHTIRGTVLGSCAVTARALIEAGGMSAIDASLFPRAALGVVALLCGNGYIVGINQIYDVSIDKVNKPFLPVAAGELSPPMAWALCLALAAGGLAITAANFGPLITGLYAFGLALGTAYSVPPLHLKRFPVLAFLIIATVRGFLLNFGVYHAARAALALPFQWCPAILFITSFVTVFATVIAVTKDMPDIEGDRKYGVSTFASRMGAEKLSYVAAGLLVANYVAAAAAPFAFPGSFNVPLMTGAHAIIAVAVVAKTAALKAAAYTQDAIKEYYRFIWSIFYTEYALLPFI